MDSVQIPEELLDSLVTAVGGGHVITDPEVMAPFLVDWTGRFSGEACCVVRPGSTDEVAWVLRACSAAGVPVVVQGGNTGLVGGGVPGAAAGGDSVLPIVLSTVRLDWISEVDALTGQISAGAGATLGAVQRAATAEGWMYGVDLAARDSATIGGTVATNAGGIRVIAYGMTRAQLVGIEAVMADGSVISHMGGLLKDNTGIDLAALLCGSEGTLAVITAVRLRLHRPPLASTVALIGCSSYGDALDLVSSAVAPGYRLLAAEVIDAVGLQLALKVTGLPGPLAQKYPLMLLLEVEDGGTGSGLHFDNSREVVVGLDRAGRERLWRYREYQSEAFSSLGVIHKLDVSIPLPNLAQCAAELDEVVRGFPGVREFGIFGHLGDGNLHVEIAGLDADDMSVDTAVLECVARHGGSVSAEHGIGRAKVEHLGLSRSAVEITAMRAVKQAWDPQGLLNPGVLLAQR